MDAKVFRLTGLVAVLTFCVTARGDYPGSPFLTRTGHGDVVTSVALTPDGRLIVSGGFDGTVKVWYLGGIVILGRPATIREVNYPRPGDLLLSLPVAGSGDAGHAGGVWSVAVTPDSQHVVSAGADSTIKVWQLSDGRLERTISGHTGAVRSLAISPDGQTIVSGSADSTIRVWRYSDGALLRTLPVGSYGGHDATVGSVAISPDGQTIVSGGGDGTIKIWQLETGALVRTLTGHTFGRVNSVVITPDGQTIISGGDDRTVRVWRLSDGALLRTLPVAGNEAAGHTNAVTSVAFAAYRARIVSASLDGTIKVWGLNDGSLCWTLTGHTGAVNSVVVTNGDEMTVSAGSDSTLKAWFIVPSAVETPVAPTRFALHTNAPNPFNPATTIRFDLPEAGNVALVIYDINGRQVRNLLVGQAFLPGQHSVTWDGCDNHGRAVASGVYLMRLTAPEGVLTGRMVLLR